MHTVTKSRLDYAVKELQRVEKDKNTIGFQRGELKRQLEQIATKYDLSFNTIRNIYYKEVKDNLNTFDTKPIQQLRTKPKTPVSAYKAGQLLKLRVTKVFDYGAFAENISGAKIEGLIHVSEIKNEYVDNIHNYLKAGDIVDAKIKKITYDHKVEFTIKDIPQTPLAKKPLQEDSLTDIMSYLNGVVGALSPNAKVKLKEMITEYGIVKFTIAMMQAGKTFENDLGLILLDKIQEKVEDCL